MNAAALDMAAEDLASGKGHSNENFPVASRLIAPRHRAPVMAFYRFARAADDVADNALAEPQTKLELLEVLRADCERRGRGADLSYSGDAFVTVRPDAFKRCLVNLVANAQAHAKRLHIDALRDQRFLTINIDDDGPGIPDDKLEDVFKPFYRVEGSRNATTGGVGLGLPIAQDIILSHGGSIRLSRSPRGGLRVFITLPV